MKKMLLIYIVALLSACSPRQGDAQPVRVEWLRSENLIIYNAYPESLRGRLQKEDVVSLLIEFNPAIIPEDQLLYGLKQADSPNRIFFEYASPQTLTFLQKIGLTGGNVVPFRRFVLNQAEGESTHIWREQWYEINEAFTNLKDAVKIGGRRIHFTKVRAADSSAAAVKIRGFFISKTAQPVFPHLIVKPIPPAPKPKTAQPEQAEPVEKTSQPSASDVFDVFVDKYLWPMLALLAAVFFAILWFKAQQEAREKKNHIASLFEVYDRRRPSRDDLNNSAFLEHKIVEIADKARVANQPQNKEYQKLGETTVLRRIDEASRGFFANDKRQDHHRLHPENGLDGQNARRLQSIFDKLKKSAEESEQFRKWLLDIKDRLGIAADDEDGFFRGIQQFKASKTFADDIRKLPGFDRLSLDGLRDKLEQLHVDSREVDQFLGHVRASLPATSLPANQAREIDSLTSVLQVVRALYEKERRNMLFFKKLKHGFQESLGAQLQGEDASELERALPNAFDGVRRKISGLERDKIGYQNRLRTAESTVQPFLDYVHIPKDRLVASGGVASVRQVVQYFQRKEVFVPDFIKILEPTLAAIEENVNQIVNSMRSDSVFRSSFRAILVGERGNAGIREARNILGTRGQRERLLQTLGVRNDFDLRNLDQKAFYENYLKPHFLRTLNDFMRLHLYKDIKLNNLDIGQDFQRDQIPSRRMERIHNRLEDYLSDAFDLRMTTVRLYQDRFDGARHKSADYAILMRLDPGRYDRLHQLQAGVIYDIKSVGLDSERLGIHQWPEVVYKVG